MITIKFNKDVIDYDPKNNEVYVNGKLDENKRYSPSFVDNKDDTVTFIGITDNKTNKFISLTGKVMEIVKPDEIKL